MVKVVAVLPACRTSYEQCHACYRLRTPPSPVAIHVTAKQAQWMMLLGVGTVGKAEARVAEYSCHCTTCIRRANERVSGYRMHHCILQVMHRKSCVSEVRFIA